MVLGGTGNDPLGSANAGRDNRCLLATYARRLARCWLRFRFWNSRRWLRIGRRMCLLLYRWMAGFRTGSIEIRRKACSPGLFQNFIYTVTNMNVFSGLRLGLRSCDNSHSEAWILSHLTRRRHRPLASTLWLMRLMSPPRTTSIRHIPPVVQRGTCFADARRR